MGLPTWPPGAGTPVGCLPSLGKRPSPSVRGGIKVNDFEKLPKTDACQEDDDADFPDEQPMGEIDRRAGRIDRRLLHRGADERLAAVPFDQAGHFLRPTTLERGDPEVGERERRRSVGHTYRKRRENGASRTFPEIR